VFGENKALLIDFLNVVIQKEQKIDSIEYLQPEQMTKWKYDRRAIFDIYCKSTQGERFIVELQIAQQQFFMERLLFYLSFPIQNSIKRGAKEFAMKPLYCVAILDFPFFEDEQYINHVSLIREETNQKVTDVLNIIMIELPKFNKQLNELETKLDNWLYCFQHLKTLKQRPVELTGSIFEELFTIAEKNNLTQEDMNTYKKSVLEYDDVRSAMAFNRDAVRKEGRKEILSEIITRGFQAGVSVEILAQMSGLSADYILMNMTLDNKSSSAQPEN
jgi:predicted transposase/invertase (TIGR01784 family)